MKLVSNLDAGFQNFSSLLALPGEPKLRRIWAVSAYYDTACIEQLIEYMDECGAKGHKATNLELIIVLDRRAKGDKKLEELDEKIREKRGCRKRGCRSGIYLSYLGQLFHSKGYLVESQNVGKCVVGSLNLTKGLTNNAELLAFFNYEIYQQSSYASKFAEHFKEYVEKILRCACPVSEANGMPSRKGSHIRDFFLEGRLYYEAIEVGPFGFKLTFPDKFSNRQSELSPLLEDKSSDILDVREFEVIKESSKGNERKRRKRSRWKDYCFQTCYGYWAPDFHEEGIEKEIVKKENCAKIYRDTFCELSKNKKELYNELLKECQRIVCQARKLNIVDFMGGWKFLSDNGRVDENKLRGEWDRWFKKLMQKNNEEVISRLCHDVRSVKMPDIWEDREAVKVFKDSFKNSFRYYKEHKKGSKNKLFHFFDSFQDFKNIINAVDRLADGEKVSCIKSINKELEELEQSMPEERLQPHLDALVAQGRLVQKESREGARYCLPGAQSDDLSLEKRIHDWLKQNDS